MLTQCQSLSNGFGGLAGGGEANKENEGRSNPLLGNGSAGNPLAQQTQTKDLSFFNVKDKVKEMEKDMTPTIFEAAKKLLEKHSVNKLSYMEKQELFFSDYDMMPLFVQENYLKYYEARGVGRGLKGSFGVRYVRKWLRGRFCA